MLERLTIGASTLLPADVTPYLAPDATALGQIFWYTVEGEGKSLDELRAVQDFHGALPASTRRRAWRRWRASAGSCASTRWTWIPRKLRAYGLPLASVYAAIATQQHGVGGEGGRAEEQRRVPRFAASAGSEGSDDLENVVIASRGGRADPLKDVATVQLGPEFRRSALEKNGQRSGRRRGDDALWREPARRHQGDQGRRSASCSRACPQGVRIVPFYDRTRLIESAHPHRHRTLEEEMIIASIAILLILTHFRSGVRRLRHAADGGAGLVPVHVLPGASRATSCRCAGSRSPSASWSMRRS